MNVSSRRAYAELARALAVKPGATTTCRVCGDAYVPWEHVHILCGGCFRRLRRVASYREVLLLVALRELARRDATGATPAATGAATAPEMTDIA